MLNPRILVADRGAALIGQVTRALASARPRPDVVPCPRVSVLDEVLKADGPFDVLVAGPSLLTTDGVAHLRHIRTSHPRLALVMAASDRPSVAFRDLVRVGAVDVLLLPVDDKVLAEAVGEAVDIARAVGAAVGASRADARAPDSSVLTVLSATGGSGKTFLATNLAYYAHNRLKKRVCVLDLDLQFGELATALRLRPRYTLVDALERGEGDEGLDAAIEEFLVTHDTGVHVLAGPADPVDADNVGSADVARLIAALRARFDLVIADTPASLNETVLAAVDLSDGILAVATLDLPSVRNMGMLLSTLGQLRIPDEHIQLVLNKVERDVGIEVDQVAEYFPQGFSAVVPYGREVSRSLNMGMPMLAYLPAADVSRSLNDGLAKLLPAQLFDDLPPAEENGHAARRKGSWWPRGRVVRPARSAS